MLTDEKLKAFIPTVKPKEAKLFYRGILGLTLLSEDNYALEVETSGALLRITTVQDLTPHPFTILGCNLNNIIPVIKELNGKNIFCERYDFLEQDNMGIWTSPNGSKVAWFKDPDGNVLSLTEYGSLNWTYGILGYKGAPDTSQLKMDHGRTIQQALEIG